MPWCTWRGDANEALDPQLWYITCVPLGQAILGAGAMEKRFSLWIWMVDDATTLHGFFRCALIISDKPSLHGWVAHLNCSRFTASGLWAPHSLLSFGARSNWPRTQRSNKHQRSFPRFCWTKNNTSIRVPQKKKECLALLNSAWLLSVSQYLSLFLYIRREKSLSSSMLRE